MSTHMHWFWFLCIPLPPIEHPLPKLVSTNVIESISYRRLQVSLNPSNLLVNQSLIEDHT